MLSVHYCCFWTVLVGIPLSSPKLASHEQIHHSLTRRFGLLTLSLVSRSCGTSEGVFATALDAEYATASGLRIPICVAVNSISFLTSLFGDEKVSLMRHSHVRETLLAVLTLHRVYCNLGMTRAGSTLREPESLSSRTSRPCGQ